MSSYLTSSCRPDGRRGRRPAAASFLVGVCVTLLLWLLCGAAQPSLARLERQTYTFYRTPHLCSYQMMESVGCGGDTPMCCVASSAIRCCAGSTSCGNCTSDVVGYEMPKSSVILGCFSLSVLVLLGSIIMSGVGRHLAWVLERRRVIENYRKRLALRRAEAREFKKELAETEEKDIEDSVACVICCARHIDVALTPCGHVCCCRFCAKRLRECPVCRGAVQRCFDLPLYYVKQLVKAAAEEPEGGDDTAAASPTTSTTTTAASAAEGEGGMSGVVDERATRENQEAQRAQHRSSHRTAAHAPQRQRDVEDWEEEEVEAEEDGVEVEAAQTRRFNPFRARRYTRLLDEGDEDAEEEAAAQKSRVSEAMFFQAAAAAAAVPSRTRDDSHAGAQREMTVTQAAPVAVAAAASSSSTPAVAAARQDGYITVEK